MKGQIHGFGFDKITKLVTLEGQYIYAVPLPAIGTFQATLTAHLAVDNNWNGRGGFEYVGHRVEHVPVASTDC